MHGEVFIRRSMFKLLHECPKRDHMCEYCSYHDSQDIIMEESNVPPVVFTVTEFQRKKQGNEEWTSPPYYTHIGGYKFCLKVYPNGEKSGKGTHVSVHAYLMRGEHDDLLGWPFEGSTTIELLNQRDDKGHHSITLNLNRYSDDDGACTSRVVDKETARGYGPSLFISHADLTEYLQDDCLRLRVSNTVVYSTALLRKTPCWQKSLNQSVCEFTLTEFSTCKQFNNNYYSPPFYTHEILGYKMCLNVFANGNRAGEGTHVSIYATLMRGEYDRSLLWPFIGDITIKLLNWREDKRHHTMKLPINFSNGYVRVTQGVYGKSVGYPQFISHSSLPYDSTTNTEYLQEDCLRLRTSGVK